MSLAAERTWLMIAIELAKMQRDASIAGQTQVGMGSYAARHRKPASTTSVRVQ